MRSRKVTRSPGTQGTRSRGTGTDRDPWFLHIETRRLMRPRDQDGHGGAGLVTLTRVTRCHPHTAERPLQAAALPGLAPSSVSHTHTPLHLPPGVPPPGRLSTPCPHSARALTAALLSPSWSPMPAVTPRRACLAALTPRNTNRHPRDSQARPASGASGAAVEDPGGAPGPAVLARLPPVGRPVPCGAAPPPRLRTTNAAPTGSCTSSGDCWRSLNTRTWGRGTRKDGSRARCRQGCRETSSITVPLVVTGTQVGTGPVTAAEGDTWVSAPNRDGAARRGLGVGDARPERAGEEQGPGSGFSVTGAPAHSELGLTLQVSGAWGAPRGPWGPPGDVELSHACDGKLTQRVMFAAGTRAETNKCGVLTTAASSVGRQANGDPEGGRWRPLWTRGGGPLVEGKPEREGSRGLPATLSPMGSPFPGVRRVTVTPERERFRSGKDMRLVLQCHLRLKRHHEARVVGGVLGLSRLSI